MKRSGTKEYIVHCRTVRRRSRKAIDTALSSNLPDKLKLLIYHLTSFTRVHHDLEWCWVAQTELARRLAISDRTVRRYVKILAEIGVLRIEAGGPRKLSLLLRERYGEGLPKSIKTRKRICSYTMLWEHDLWKTGLLAEKDLFIITQSYDREKKP